MTVRLVVVGASGRMGKAIVRLASERSDVVLVGAVGLQNTDVDVGVAAGVRALDVAIEPTLDVIGRTNPDVLIDFTSPGVTAEVVPIASQHRVRIVSGTTGLSEIEMQMLDAAAHTTAVLWEPNMSVGVHVLSRIVASAIEALGPGFDAEIVEAHHRMKIDAPSGTAIRLAEVVERTRAKDKLVRVYGREGKPGRRPSNEVAVLAMRGGDVIGDHTVHLMGLGERLELTHRATSRDVFAHGALRAAVWIAKKGPGRYSLSDVIGDA